MTSYATDLLDAFGLAGLIALPAAGAVLIWLRAASREHARDAQAVGEGALTAGLVAIATAGLAASCIARLAAGADVFTTWGGWGEVLWARPTLTLDVPRAAFVATLALLTPVALLASSSARPMCGAGHLAGLLALESALMLAALSGDLLVFCLAMQIATVLAASSLTPPEAYPETRRPFWLAVQATGGGLMLAGTLALGSAHYRQAGAVSFALPDLQAVAASAPLATGLLTVGLLVRTMIVPACAFLPGSLRNAPAGGVILTLGGLGKLAILAIVVLLQPLQPPGLAGPAAAWASLVPALGAITAMVLCLQGRSIAELLAYSTAFHACFCLFAVTVGTTGATTGALVHCLAHALSLGGIGLGLARTLPRPARAARSDLSGSVSRRALPAMAGALLMLTTASIPGLAGFVGPTLALQDAVGRIRQGSTPWAIPAALVALALAVHACWAITTALRMLVRTGQSGAPPAEPDTLHRLRAADTLSLLFTLLLILAWLGVHPQPAVTVISSATSALLARAQRAAPSLPEDAPDRPTEPHATPARPARTSGGPLASVGRWGLLAALVLTAWGSLRHVARGRPWAWACAWALGQAGLTILSERSPQAARASPDLPTGLLAALWALPLAGLLALGALLRRTTRDEARHAGLVGLAKSRPACAAAASVLVWGLIGGAGTAPWAARQRLAACLADASAVQALTGTLLYASATAAGMAAAYLHVAGRIGKDVPRPELTACRERTFADRCWLGIVSACVTATVALGVCPDLLAGLARWMTP